MACFHRGRAAERGWEWRQSAKDLPSRASEKVLELVQQDVEMTVFVNPEPSGADEWVIRGEIWEIGSPQLESSWGPTTVGGG